MGSEEMMKKTFVIFLNAVPVLAMIALIPFIKNDYVLMIVYIGIIAASLTFKYAPHDFLILVRRREPKNHNWRGLATPASLRV